MLVLCPIFAVQGEGQGPRNLSRRSSGSCVVRSQEIADEGQHIGDICRLRRYENGLPNCQLIHSVSLETAWAAASTPLFRSFSLRLFPVLVITPIRYLKFAPCSRGQIHQFFSCLQPNIPGELFCAAVPVNCEAVC